MLYYYNWDPNQNHYISEEYKSAVTHLSNKIGC